MNTENIIENLLNGNIATAKKETEDLLYSKVGEAINFISDGVVDSVYGLQEKKEKKKSAEDEITFAPSTELEDDGEGMDPVGAEDGDVDNDGDEDESDNYLKNRRKVRKKKINKDDSESEEVDEWVVPAIRGAVAIGSKLLKTKVGKEVATQAATAVVNKGVQKIKNRKQVPPNAPGIPEEMQNEGDDGRGDGRREFVYGMKVSRYEKLTDKLKAKVKQQWHNSQAEEERVKGKA